MKTVVITSGGLGTRLLSVTKSNPKIMLPLYERSFDNVSEPLAKPIGEIIFDNLYEHGFRKFCYVIGDTKSPFIEHMTPEKLYISILEKRGTVSDKRFINYLKKLYKKIEDSEIHWIIQNEPLGFGDAVLKAKKIVGRNNFLLHTGDAYFPNYNFLGSFIKKHEKDKNDCSMVFQKMNSVKGYGIVEIKKQKHENIIVRAKEKPKKPFSNLVILPLYIFNSKIFDVLTQTPNGFKNELQLTDAIQLLIKKGVKIRGVDMGRKKWFDIGTPKNYLNALNFSYKLATKKNY